MHTRLSESLPFSITILGMKSPPSAVVVGASKPTLSKSVSVDVGEPQQAAYIMEDEYIEMDAVVPDPTEKTEPTTPSQGRCSWIVPANYRAMDACMQYYARPL